MRKTLAIIFGILLFITLMLVYFRWSSAIRQPAGFDHAQHVHAAIQCVTCHVQKSSDALPETTICASCHTGMKVPADLRWIRVYRVAPDIIFSHEQHGEENCSVCHSAMTSARRWVHETRFKMAFCIKCHEQRKARNDCHACHKYK